MDDMMLVPIAEAARWFPPRGERPVGVKAVVRRIREGHRGVRLEARLDGGRWFTCRRWVEDFQAAVTAASVPSVRTPSQQTRAVAQARATLARRFGFRAR